MASLDQFKQIFFTDINCINFMHDQRQNCLTMQLMDGGISKACLDRWEEQYQFWDKMIYEFEQFKKQRKGASDEH